IRIRPIKNATLKAYEKVKALDTFFSFLRFNSEGSMPFAHLATPSMAVQRRIKKERLILAPASRAKPLCRVA
ncbi:MAG TPA: hypothetical protein VGR36_05620, partial [Candidatus Acidoferrales bacterium]|nr:hypothetical protein [Candidatus Acidoferrales bacterium]